MEISTAYMRHLDILSLAKGKSTIFVNRNLLSNNYIPPVIVGREKQIADVARIFTPIFSEEFPAAPNNTVIYGKVGVGKTLVLSHVVRELIHYLNEHHFLVVQLRCDLITITQILNEVIFRIDQTQCLPKTGLPVGAYLQRVYDLLNGKNKSLILILDEVDKLANFEIFYSFSRTSEGRRKLNLGLHISLILLTNDLSFKENLETRIDSSLASSYLVFPAYTPSELTAILQDRRSAFKDGAVDDPIFKYIAALSANEHGDARKALQLLRLSGESAERRGSSIIKDTDVVRGNELLIASLKVEGIKGFNPQLQLTALSVILSMSDDRPGQELIVTRTAYDKYKQLCQASSRKAMSITRFSSYITELDMHNILDTNLEYCGRAGKKRKISLQLNQAEVAEIVEYIRDALHLYF
jgi:archaeal cell division control protein 6